MTSLAAFDATTRGIGEYVSSLAFEDLSPQVVHDCKRRVIDTLGCALGAYDAGPCRIARRLAERATVEKGCRVLVSGHRTLPELATFANGTMMRYLDGNDAVPGGGGGHPSDVMGAVLAAADLAGADGKRLITALIAAYEVFINYFRSARLRDEGWDHVVYTAAGSAAGSAKAMGLTQDQIQHAVALAVTPNFALEVTRRGDLSMWKGCAAPNAARNGIFAALLAAEGATGPSKPFEGAHGAWDTLRKRFQLAPFPRDGRTFAMLEVNLKKFLAEFHAQAPIVCAIELSRKVRAGDIKSVTIFTYRFAWQEIGSEPEKWHPTTRETADHSVPYMVAATLLDGAFSDAVFSGDRLKDPAIHALVDRITVKEDAEFTRQYPALNPCRIEIETIAGETVVSSIDFPRGHARNPMTDDEVAEKFDDLARRALPRRRVPELLDALWKLEHAPDTGSLLDLCTVTKESR
jgi:2-methylcitrate dehydratase